MATLETIDLEGITPHHLHLIDSSALSERVQKEISPTRPMVDGAGFDNRS